MSRLCAGVAILMYGLLLCPLPSFAHGGPPLPVSIHHFSSSDGEEGGWVFVTNFGMITSATPDRYVCEEAFFGGDRFGVEPLGLEHWVLFTRNAVYLTRDGCYFDRVHDLPALPSATASHAASGQVALLLNGVQDSGIYYSADGGESFRRLGVNTSGMRLTEARFMNAQTLLISAYSEAEEERGAARLLAIDAASAQLQILPLTSGFTYPYLLAAAGDRFVWFAGRDGVSHLLWGTSEAPEELTFAPQSWPTGAAISDDGAKVWISGHNSENRGLVVGELGQEPIWTEILPEHSARCVDHEGGDLLLCARASSEGHELSRITGDDVIEPVLSFQDIKGPRRDCPSDSPTAVTCPAVWRELARALGVDPDQDGDHIRDDDDDDESEDDDDDEDQGAEPGPGPAADDEKGGCAMAAPLRPLDSRLFLPMFGLLALFGARRRKNQRR